MPMEGQPVLHDYSEFPELYPPIPSVRVHPPYMKLFALPSGFHPAYFSKHTYLVKFNNPCGVGLFHFG